ncbi:hypothetical protein D6861_010405 [Macrococcoides caseolyticum]|nr:hypothetical protein [Macrococcus caseolyticus]RKO14102.1 hypothetical protein D6861_08345 [Macrococcus caseolyticus]
MSEFIAVCSFLVSLFSVYSSQKTKRYQKELDDKILKPQLFMKSIEKQILDYEITFNQNDHSDIFFDYIINLDFFNLTDAKILDLVVSLEIQENNTCSYFIKKSLEENKYIFDDNGDYSWNRIFPLSKRIEEKKDIFYGEELKISLPSIFTAVLCGYMYVNRNENIKLDVLIPFNLNISYKHAFSNKYIKIKKSFNIKVEYLNPILQGPYILCDSIIFKKL